MRKLEVVDTERELLERIEHYRLEGVAEHNMRVVSHNRLEGSSLHYTDVDYTPAEGSFGDKVAAFFTGEDPEDRVFHHFNLQPNEEKEYIEAIDRHKIVLIVDENGFDYENNQHSSNVASIDTDRNYNQNNEGDVNMSRDRDFLNRNEGKYEFDEDIRNRNDLTEEEKIKLHEERLLVDKDRVQTGEVHVEKDVVEERQEFDVPVEREEVQIERRPVNERADGEFDAHDNETVRVPVHEERLNVEKENVVTEEIVIKKERVKDVEHVSEDVRREEIDIDETDYKDRL